jgi:mannose-6-phosphate isomerase-like protein (cupin superfamily)
VTKNRAIVIGPDEGRELSLGTMRLRFPADEPETAGRYAISVVEVPANEAGTTPHTHREHDDITLVVEGTLAFGAGDDTFEARRGTLVIIPAGVAHRWWNPRAEPAAFVNIHVPGFGFEQFVRDLAALSNAGEATPAAMADLGAAYDVHFDQDELRSRYP